MIPELTPSEYIRIVIGSVLVGIVASLPTYATSHSIEVAAISFVGFFVGALIQAFGLAQPVLNGAALRFYSRNPVLARAAKDAQEDDDNA